MTTKRSGFYPATRKPTVLVVDGDPDWQRALAGMLEGAFCVMTASSFEVAVTILAEVAIDAIVTEAVLGARTGVDLHAHVVASMPELEGALVFVTSGGFDAGLAAFFAGTTCPVVYKSLDGDSLREAVREVGRGARGAPIAAAAEPAIVVHAHVV